MRRGSQYISRSVTKAYQRLVADGKVKRGELACPGRAMNVTKGWLIARIRTTEDRDGVPIHRDATEALERLKDHPSAQHMRYVGVARGWHVFEYPGPGYEYQAGGGRTPANQGSGGDR